MSGWSPAATRCWPPSGPASARTYWPSPRSCSPPTPPRESRAAVRCGSYRGLLEHLATPTRNQVRFADATAAVPMLTEPTSAQPSTLIGVPIRLTLK